MNPREKIFVVLGLAAAAIFVAALLVTLLVPVWGIWLKLRWGIPG